MALANDNSFLSFIPDMMIDEREQREQTLYDIIMTNTYTGDASFPI